MTDQPISNIRDEAKILLLTLITLVMKLTMMVTLMLTMTTTVRLTRTTMVMMLKN